MGFTKPICSQWWSTATIHLTHIQMSCHEGKAKEPIIPVPVWNKTVLKRIICISLLVSLNINAHSDWRNIWSDGLHSSSSSQKGREWLVTLTLINARLSNKDFLNVERYPTPLKPCILARNPELGGVDSFL